MGKGAGSGVSALVGMILWSGAASAQEAPSNAPAGERASEEEIIVNARRRDENLQDVPLSVTVVSQERLEENNVATLGDLQYLVPSLSASTAFSREGINVSVRGLGTNGLSGLPGVIAYLDEVPIPTSMIGDAAGGPGLLFDLDNVQVLKGPQGTLFGRNTTGGALLLRSASPQEEFGGALQVGIGNYENREYDAHASFPLLGGALLARVAINGQSREGFTHVLQDADNPTGFDADARDFGSARVALSFRPTSDFQNDLRLTYTSYDTNGSPLLLTAFDPTQFVPGLFPDLAGYFAQQRQLGPRTAIGSDISLVSNGQALFVSNVSRLDLSDTITLRNIVGYDRFTTKITLDGDGSPLPILDAISAPQKETVVQFTEELQLLGDTANFDWIVGAFYVDSRPDEFVEQQQIFFFGSVYNEYEPSSTSRAVYAQGSYDLSSVTEGLSATAGVRYTSDRRQQVLRMAVNGPDMTSRSSSNALTYNFSLEQRLGPDTLVYALTRRGYRAGGFNIPGSDPAEFSPEFVTDYEAGLKSDWSLFGVPVRTNIAAYRMDYEDVQVQANLVQPDGSFALLTTNAAAARIFGMEFEATVYLTENLQIGLNYDRLDFEYTDFDAAVDPATLTGGTENGGRIPNKWGVSVRYSTPLSQNAGEVSFQASYNWQDDYGDFSIAGGGTEAFGLLNASASWDRVFGLQIDLQVFGSNLTDELYNIGPAALHNSAFGFSVGRYGEPRMYGARVRYHFGAD